MMWAPFWGGANMVYLQKSGYLESILTKQLGAFSEAYSAMIESWLNSNLKYSHTNSWNFCLNAALLSRRNAIPKNQLTAKTLWTACDLAPLWIRFANPRSLLFSKSPQAPPFHTLIA